MASEQEIKSFIDGERRNPSSGKWIGVDNLQRRNDCHVAQAGPAKSGLPSLSPTGCLGSRPTTVDAFCSPLPKH